MGRYSNPDIVTRLERILSGRGRDRVSHRPVRSPRQKQTRLTDSLRPELVERYLAGESSNALAKEFGVDRHTAARIIRSAGVEVRYRVDVDVERARKLYESGFSLAKVGEELGVSTRTVLNRFRRRGIPTREVGTNQWSQ
jgi:DNA invertase Pin-like site-specific DNA recombinase